MSSAGADRGEAAAVGSTASSARRRAAGRLPVLARLSALALGTAAALWLAAGPAGALDPPLRPVEEVERYLSEHQDALREQVEAYNGRVGVLRSQNGSTRLLGAFWRVQRLDGDRVFLVGRIEVGRASWDGKYGRFSFEFQWRGGELKLLGHGPPPALQDAGVKEGIGQECVPNYYAPNPCLDTIQRWTDFSRIYGLPLDRSSAAIFQSFAQDDFRTGDRLLAAALGEPAPVVESAFALQDEVDALNLSRFQQNLESPCDLSPSGPKPCPQIEGVYRAFAQRHGLPEGPASAQMFAAYARGDFRSGDTLYALAMNLPRPTYDEPTTGIGRDAALAGLRPGGPGETGECSLNPHATRPCLSSVEAWQAFRARYRLPDTLESARIFEAYAEGDFSEGDELFAEAKGVSVVQLLEAAGVEPDRLIIEVYPGRRG